MLNHTQMHNVFPEGGGGGGGGGSNGCLSLPGRDCLWHIFCNFMLFQDTWIFGGGMSGPHDSPLDPRMLNRPYLIREGTPPPLHSPTPSGDLIFMWKLPSITLYMYLVFPKNAPQ